MRRALCAAGVAAAFFAAAAAPAHAATERLYRPGQESYYAFVNRATAARAEPKPSARTVARLKLRTQDGTDELVLALSRTTDANGRVWLKVRLPVRPNGTTGWVAEEDLGPLQPLKTWLKIDTTALRATLVRGGKAVFHARIGVGQPQWPTPKGDFYIRSKLTGYGARGSFYGPVAFGTSATSDTLTDWPGGGIVGIHGTSEPGLIPGRVSHGCVRLRNADIVRLARLMPVGTPVSIR
jgi:lipoprotein-anchoring transpeptidase ErfK/SrfK